jgi:hypothetical protein
VWAECEYSPTYHDGNIEAVKQHLDAGTDVNAKDWDGKTPLDWADGETAASSANSAARRVTNWKLKGNEWLISVVQLVT